MIQLRRRTVATTLISFAVAFAMVTAIAVTALVRTADAGSNGFTDTPPWIAAHAAWLVSNGIADGYDNNTFRPNLNITRGQAAYWFGNYNTSIELVQEEHDPSEGTAFADDITCPAGKRAVGGGGDTSETNVFMTDSRPVNAATWQVRWETDNNASLDPSSVRVYALCIPDPIPEP